MSKDFTNYKYILFDLDGTLTDPKIGITKSIDYALSYFDIKTDNLDDLCKFIGPPLTNAFKEFYGFNDEQVTTAIFKYRERFSDVGLYENEVYNGIKVLLNNLKLENKTLILATSKPATFANRILEHFGLSKYFTFVSGSELDGTRTEKSEVIAYALEQNNITELSKVIMIGDRKHDIIGAKKCGIDSIGILYGFGNREELEEAGADFIFESVESLSENLLKTRTWN